MRGAFPDEGWERPAHRVADYLATRRDRAEGLSVRQPDHWAAYGLAELAPAGLTDVEAEYGRWLAGYFGFMDRLEAQHAGSVLNPFSESGAGLGTMGEATAALWRLAGEDPRLADLRDDLADRSTCHAGILLDRQVGPADPNPAGARRLVHGRLHADGRPAARPRRAPGLPGGAPVSFGFLIAGFLATTNAGRVALACRGERPTPRALAVALIAGLALVALGAILADELLDALAISPESFRIAAGIVLAAAGVRTIVWPEPSGPFEAILVTPALACLAVSSGADEGAGKALAAAVIALAVVAIAALARPREPAAGLATQFLAALQVVIAVALVISGVRDV